MINDKNTLNVVYEEDRCIVGLLMATKENIDAIKFYESLGMSVKNMNLEKIWD